MMSKPGQLIVLEWEFPEEDEIILLKDVYEFKAAGCFTEIAIVGRRNFLGVDATAEQHNILHQHVNGQ